MQLLMLAPIQPLLLSALFKVLLILSLLALGESFHKNECCFGDSNNALILRGNNGV